MFAVETRGGDGNSGCLINGDKWGDNDTDSDDACS
jgi:hypothetical protein